MFLTLVPLSRKAGRLEDEEEQRAEEDHQRRKRRMLQRA